MEAHPNLNLAFDAKRLFLNKAGLGNYSRWLIRGLLNTCPENQIHLYTTCVTEIEKEYLDENCHIHLPPYLFKSFWRTKSIKKDLLRDKINVYHGLSNELPIGIESTGIKSIVTIHDLIFKQFPEFYNPIDRLIYDRKFKSACKRADKIVAISHFTKKSIVEFYGIAPEKIEVIYIDASERFHQKANLETVDQAKQKFGLEKPYFLNVGAIGGRKNQLRLVEAFAAVCGDIEHDLVLIGRGGKDLEALNELIKSRNLTNRIKHFANINDEDLFHLYHGSYATVYPSLFEGFGIPIIESYRCAKPVLTSRGSSLEEMAGKAALLCNPLDIEEMAQQLIKLSDQKTYLQLVSFIPHQLKAFDPSDLFSKYESLYRFEAK